MRVILASSSPRRRELLSRIVSDFDVIPAKGEERAQSHSPEEIAKELAKRKCDEVFFRCGGDNLVIGCDTIVAFEGKIFGKPADERAAYDTLCTLSGNTHEVITGVCVRYKDKISLCGVTSRVTFNELSENFIKDYVKSGSPMDKAGSYGIQDEGIVKSCEGSFTNVVGMPVETVKKMIREVLGYDAFGN